MYKIGSFSINTSDSLLKMDDPEVSIITPGLGTKFQALEKLRIMIKC
jgi:hypothetical protein